MRFTQLALVALAPLAFAQETETIIGDVIPTPDVPSPELPSVDLPTPTQPGEDAGPTLPGDAIDSASEIAESASSAIASLTDAASSLVSSSISASESDEAASLSDLIRTATDSSVIASASDALDELTSSDDGNAAARPTGAIAAGALFGGAAILANL